MNVLVLMSTYNGGKFLTEQLDSVLKQEKVNVNILVRDDGSSDNTISILEKYSAEKKLKWYSGENMGAKYSFMDLVKHAKGADYYAFCDQDDVWKPNKLYKAVRNIEDNNLNNRPMLYCSDYQLVDSNLKPLKENGHITSTSFACSLAGSCCTGCTVVFNQKLLFFLKQYMPNDLIMHDDWCHKVCLAIGGEVIYDSYKSLFYRQHDNNVDGGIHSMKSRFLNVIRRIISPDEIRSKQLYELVDAYGNLMSPENLKLAYLILNYKKMNIINRIRLCMKSNFLTQSNKVNDGFRLAIIFKYY